MTEWSTFIDGATYRIGWMLVHTIWQATLIAMLLAAVLRIGRVRMSPSARYITSCISLLGILCASAATLALTPAPLPPALTTKGPGAVFVGALLATDPPAPAMSVQPTAEASAVV